MSFEVVKVLGTDKIITKDKREINFLNLEVSVSLRLFVGDNIAPIIPLFNQFVGRHALLKAEWSEYNGKPTLSLFSDSRPVLCPAELLDHYQPSVLVDQKADYVAGFTPEQVDSETGEIVGGVKDSVSTSVSPPPLQPSKTAGGLFSGKS